MVWVQLIRWIKMYIQNGAAPSINICKLFCHEWQKVKIGLVPCGTKNALRHFVHSTIIRSRSFETCERYLISFWHAMCYSNMKLFESIHAKNYENLSMNYFRTLPTTIHHTTSGAVKAPNALPLIVHTTYVCLPNSFRFTNWAIYRFVVYVSTQVKFDIMSWIDIIV